MIPDLSQGLRRDQIDRAWMIVAVGLAAALVALLADSVGIAIVIAAAVVPTVLVVLARSVDVFEDESLLALGGVAIAGFVGGLIVALANDVLFDELWLDNSILNIGATGFGGSLARDPGSPPLSLVFLSGLAIPILGEALKLAGPMAMRRWPAFRNEVMDGFTLGAAAGAGFATAGAVVFLWPLIQHDAALGGDVSEWTSIVIGLVAVRSAIVVLVGALNGAGVWHAALTRRRADAVRSIGPAMIAVVLYPLGNLLMQPSSSLSELVWGLLIVVGLVVVARGVIRAALGRDRSAFGPGTGRQLCQTCGAITPDGTFCARCGAPLPPTASAVPVDRTTPVENAAHESPDADRSTPDASPRPADAE